MEIAHCLGTIMYKINLSQEFTLCVCSVRCNIPVIPACTAFCKCLYLVYVFLFHTTVTTCHVIIGMNW